MSDFQYLRFSRAGESSLLRPDFCTAQQRKMLVEASVTMDYVQSFLLIAGYVGGGVGVQSLGLHV